MSSIIEFRLFFKVFLKNEFLLRKTKIIKKDNTIRTPTPAEIPTTSESLFSAPVFVN